MAMCLLWLTRGRGGGGRGSFRNAKEAAAAYSVCGGRQKGEGGRHVCRRPRASGDVALVQQPRNKSELPRKEIPPAHNTRRTLHRGPCTVVVPHDEVQTPGAACGVRQRFVSSCWSLRTRPPPWCTMTRAGPQGSGVWTCFASRAAGAAENSPQCLNVQGTHQRFYGAGLQCRRPADRSIVWSGGIPWTSRTMEPHAPWVKMCPAGAGLMPRGFPGKCFWWHLQRSGACGRDDALTGIECNAEWEAARGDHLQCSTRERTAGCTVNTLLYRRSKRRPPQCCIELHPAVRYRRWMTSCIGSAAVNLHHPCHDDDHNVYYVYYH
eukprot:jgi/Botrbrau1/14031/Bobra.0310s0016.1